MSGSLLPARPNAPPGTKNLAKTSSRYPASTALSRLVAASRSVDWMMASLLRGPVAAPDAGGVSDHGLVKGVDGDDTRPRPARPRPLLPRAKVERCGICGAAIRCENAE